MEQQTQSEPAQQTQSEPLDGWASVRKTFFKFGFYKLSGGCLHSQHAPSVWAWLVWSRCSAALSEWMSGWTAGQLIQHSQPLALSPGLPILWYDETPHYQTAKSISQVFLSELLCGVCEERREELFTTAGDIHDSGILGEVNAVYTYAIIQHSHSFVFGVLKTAVPSNSLVWASHSPAISTGLFYMRTLLKEWYHLNSHQGGNHFHFALSLLTWMMCNIRPSIMLYCCLLDSSVHFQW